MLIKSGITYNMVGGLKFYDRKEIKDIIAYLRVIFNPADSLSLLRIINAAPRYRRCNAGQAAGPCR